MTVIETVSHGYNRDGIFDADVSKMEYLLCLSIYQNTVCCFEGLQDISFTFVCESISTEVRHLMAILGNALWVVAYVLIGILAMYFKNWRTLTMVASIPMLVTISFHW